MPQSFDDSFIQGGVSTIDYPADLLKTNAINSYDKSKSTGLWELDMAREYMFSVEISGISNNKIKHKRYGNFLPVTQIQYKSNSPGYTRIETGVYGDLPLLNGMSLGTIDLTIADTDDHKDGSLGGPSFDQQLHSWYKLCMPNKGFVPYMSTIIKTLTYNSYNVDGTGRTRAVFQVIPKGSLSVTRQTDGEEIKKIQLQLQILGDPEDFSFISENPKDWR